MAGVDEHASYEWLVYIDMIEGTWAHDSSAGGGETRGYRLPIPIMGAGVCSGVRGNAFSIARGFVFIWFYFTLR